MKVYVFSKNAPPYRSRIFLSCPHFSDAPFIPENTGNPENEWKCLTGDAGSSNKSTASLGNIRIFQ